jgi:uncharacterized protein (DUF58 family)
MSALSPAVVAALHDLELGARLVVEGFRAGGHRSPLHGFSAEFQQHRPYRAGDDLKHLDWKILGRTDRLYTRQFRESTSLGAMFVLDTSASMSYPDAPVSKFTYASLVAAALAWLISAQGDAVGLLTLQDGRFVHLPARGGRPHLRSLIARIDGLEPRGVWDGPRAISRGAELLRRRGVIVVISDFYDDEAETSRALRRAAQVGHDVAMLQVVSPEETSFPFRGDIAFVDLESGEQRLVDASGIESVYRSAVGAFLERCRTQAIRDGLDHALFSTGDPPERALRGYLLRRNAPSAVPPADRRSAG